jgi:hypothetical protein
VVPVHPEVEHCPRTVQESPPNPGMQRFAAHFPPKQSMSTMHSGTIQVFVASQYVNPEAVSTQGAVVASQDPGAGFVEARHILYVGSHT